MKKFPIIFITCVIFSAILHYVGIYGIPVSTHLKKEKLITLELAPEPKRIESLDSSKPGDSKEDEKNNEKNKSDNKVAKKINIKSLLKAKLAKLGKNKKPSAVQNNQDDDNNTLEGKDQFKGFGDNGIAEMNIPCPEKKTYFGVGASFQTENSPLNINRIKQVVQDGKQFYVLDKVKQNGPLYKAGIRPGDLITSNITQITRMPLNSEIQVLAGPRNQTKLIKLRSIKICFE